MKQPVKHFKDLKLCLKNLEPFIRNGEHLQTGKPFKEFGGLRSREILGNWLICVVYNFRWQDDTVLLCTDPSGGDGIIYDNKDKKSFYTEHVLVPRNKIKDENVESLILGAIEKKQNKGSAAYASGKHLIVFVNVDGGLWYPRRVSRKLGEKIDFQGVYVVGLDHIDDGKYTYYVTCLYPSDGESWHVQIKKDFTDWEVSRKQ